MNCKVIISNFLTYFNLNKPQKDFPNLIDLLKNYNDLNNLQMIFLFDFVSASSLFSKDGFQSVTEALTNQKQEVYTIFSKFLDYVSFRPFNISIFLSQKIYIDELNFQGWNIVDNIDDANFIFNEKKGQYLHSKRFVNKNELNDILNPPSVFRFINQKEKLQKTDKYMAFDIDGTLVNQSNILLPFVKEKLSALYSSGYNIILISNQKRRKIGDPKLQLKLEKITGQLELPFIAYCAREEDVFRKPNIGVKYLIPKFCGKMEGYVGDAAGRKGDHSLDDINLAKNMNVPFFTPEEYFNPLPILKRNQRPEIRDEKTMILMIGYPASGKSTYAKEVLSEFERFSRDDIGSAEKALKETEKALKEGKNFVIDNTNTSKKNRKDYLDLGKKYGYYIIGIQFLTSMEQAMEWDKSRGGKIPKIVYYKLRKEFENPEKDEGFDEIYSVM